MLEIEPTNFMVVATVNEVDEAFEIEKITRAAVIRLRISNLGKELFKNEKKLKEEQESLINFDENQNRENAMQIFENTNSEKNSINGTSFFKKIFDLGKAVIKSE